MTRTLFKFIIYQSCERAFEERETLLGQTQTKPYWSKQVLVWNIGAVSDINKKGHFLQRRAREISTPPIQTFSKFLQQNKWGGFYNKISGGGV